MTPITRDEIKECIENLIKTQWHLQFSDYYSCTGCETSAYFSMDKGELDCEKCKPTCPFEVAKQMIKKLEDY